MRCDRCGFSSKNELLFFDLSLDHEITFDQDSTFQIAEGVFFCICSSCVDDLKVWLKRPSHPKAILSQ